MTRRLLWTLPAVLLTALMVPLAAQSPVRTIEDGALDEIKLYVEKLPSAAHVAIRPFSATDADLTEGAKDSEDTKKMQTEAPGMLSDSFAARIKKLAPATEVSTLTADAAVPPGAIVFEGKFIEMDPGSMAKRMFIGYGAGKSGVTAKGTLKSADGTLLAEFQQRRIGMRSRGLEMLRDDTKQIGEDLAEFINKWATGKKLN
jgi:hypothetical protein